MRTRVVVAISLALCGGGAAAEPVQIRGVVRAVNEATISSDIATRVVQLPFREGDAFKKNDVLVEFDCERLKAEFKSADAERRGQLTAWQNATRLSQLGAAGSHEVAMAAAAHDKAAGLAEGLQAKVKGCQILAPFDGRVLDLNIRRYETPAVTQPLLRIVDDRTLEIEMLLPASNLKDAKIGRPFKLILDDTGRPVLGKIVRVGPALDIVSQTFKAAGALTEGGDGVLPGVSGAIILENGVM